jgi:hypothetical protein
MQRNRDEIRDDLIVMLRTGREHVYWQRACH